MGTKESLARNNLDKSPVTTGRSHRRQRPVATRRDRMPVTPRRKRRLVLGVTSQQCLRRRTMLDREPSPAAIPLRQETPQAGSHHPHAHPQIHLHTRMDGIPIRPTANHHVHAQAACIRRKTSSQLPAHGFADLRQEPARKILFQMPLNAIVRQQPIAHVSPPLVGAEQGITGKGHPSTPVGHKLHGKIFHLRIPGRSHHTTLPAQQPGTPTFRLLRPCPPAPAQAFPASGPGSFQHRALPATLRIRPAIRHIPQVHALADAMGDALELLQNAGNLLPRRPSPPALQVLRRRKRFFRQPCFPQIPAHGRVPSPRTCAPQNPHYKPKGPARPPHPRHTTGATPPSLPPSVGPKPATGSSRARRPKPNRYRD